MQFDLEAALKKAEQTLQNNKNGSPLDVAMAKAGVERAKNMLLIAARVQAARRKGNVF